MTKYYPSTRVLILLVIISALYACKKSKDDDVDPNKTYLLSKVHSIDKVSAAYTYNDQYQLTGSSFITPDGGNNYRTTSTIYHYNTDGRVAFQALTYISGSTGIIYDTIDHEYNNQGRLIIQKPRKSNNNLKTMNEYSYAGNTITETRWVDGIIRFITVFTLDGRGNIVKAETDDLGSPSHKSTEEWLDYDDKKNVVGPYAGDVVSKNNPRRIISTKNIPHTDNTYIYKYNKAGYVTESKMEGSSYVSTYEYIPVN